MYVVGPDVEGMQMPLAELARRTNGTDYQASHGDQVMKVAKVTRSLPLPVLTSSNDNYYSNLTETSFETPTSSMVTP